MTDQPPPPPGQLPAPATGWLSAATAAGWLPAAPAAKGYPPPPPGAYPPPQQGGYPPPQQGGYPSAAGGYPPPQQGGYPPPQQWYPPAQPGYRLRPRRTSAERWRPSHGPGTSSARTRPAPGSDTCVRADRECAVRDRLRHRAWPGPGRQVQTSESGFFTRHPLGAASIAVLALGGLVRRCRSPGRSSRYIWQVYWTSRTGSRSRPARSSSPRNSAGGHRGRDRRHLDGDRQLPVRHSGSDRRDLDDFHNVCHRRPESQTGRRIKASLRRRISSRLLTWLLVIVIMAVGALVWDRGFLGRPGCVAVPGVLVAPAQRRPDRAVDPVVALRSRRFRSFTGRRFFVVLAEEALPQFVLDRVNRAYCKRCLRETSMTEYPPTPENYPPSTTWRLLPPPPGPTPPRPAPTRGTPRPDTRPPPLPSFAAQGFAVVGRLLAFLIDGSRSISFSLCPTGRSRRVWRELAMVQEGTDWSNEPSDLWCSSC